MSADDGYEFRKKLADVKQDASKWTARDALQDLIDDIDSGKMLPDKLVIHYVEKLENGGYKHHWSVAGANIWEHLGLLDLAKDRMLRYWYGDTS